MRCLRIFILMAVLFLLVGQVVELELEDLEYPGVVFDRYAISLDLNQKNSFYEHWYERATFWTRVKGGLYAWRLYNHNDHMFVDYGFICVGAPRHYDIRYPQKAWKYADGFGHFGSVFDEYYRKENLKHNELSKYY